MFSKGKGFTLIELVVVIAIIGILAAVALPRFVNAQRDARIAKAQALFGSVRSASALAHSRCLLDLTGVTGATCTSTAGSANLEGLAVAMVNQYPARNTALPTVPTGSGIVAAAGINLAADAVTVTASANPTTIDINGATTVGGCRISYTEAAAGGAPTTTLVTTGC